MPTITVILRTIFPLFGSAALGVIAVCTKGDAQCCGLLGSDTSTVEGAALSASLVLSAVRKARDGDVILGLSTGLRRRSFSRQHHSAAMKSVG
jgi:hypothetical protein